MLNDARILPTISHASMANTSNTFKYMNVYSPLLCMYLFWYVALQTEAACP